MADAVKYMQAVKLAAALGFPQDGEAVEYLERAGWYWEPRRDKWHPGGNVPTDAREAGAMVQSDPPDETSSQLIKVDDPGTVAKSLVPNVPIKTDPMYEAAKLVAVKAGLSNKLPPDELYHQLKSRDWFYTGDKWMGGGKK